MIRMKQKSNVLEGIPDAAEDRKPVWGDGQTLQINEIFYSIEGEGARVGQPTTFVRLAKCNLRCFFCDTEFDTFTEMSIREIVDEVRKHSAEWVSLTGGEPLGQNVAPLCEALKGNGYRLHIETSGSLSPETELFDLIDHWTVSPKRRRVVDGFERITELKYVVGKAFREDIVEEDRSELVYLQPESSKPEFVIKTLEILQRHPSWRLSCRIHKMLHLP